MPTAGPPEAPRLRLVVGGPGAVDQPSRLEAVAALCRKRRGIRVEPSEDELRLSVDASRIEQLGPVIEAVATAHDLTLRIEDLDADIRSTGLDGRPSGLWAAIGNAALDIQLARDRGQEPAGDLFRYVRVDEIDGRRVVRDDRPPLVEPTGGPPADFGPTKYDDIDYHDGAAIEAGQPLENAFTHIGFYLAWLIRHDLHDGRLLPPEHVAAVIRGEMTGSDLADDTDNKLLADHMTDEGSAFSDARYETYLVEFGRVFADEPDYGVVDDAANYARIEPAIDALFAAWAADGRPGPKPNAASPWDSKFDGAPEAVPIPWEKLAKDADGPISVEVQRDGSHIVRPMELPHEAPELEALVPTDIIDPPISHLSSSTASHWGSSLLNRALKRLGIRPRDARVVSGIGGDGERTFTVTLYGVPGVTADRLVDEFASAIYRPPKAIWNTRHISGRTVIWAEGRVEDRQFTIAFWARDGLVVHVTGQPADVEAAIPRLP